MIDDDNLAKAPAETLRIPTVAGANVVTLLPAIQWR